VISHSISEIRAGDHPTPISKAPSLTVRQTLPGAAQLHSPVCRSTGAPYGRWHAPPMNHESSNKQKRRQSRSGTRGGAQRSSVYSANQKEEQPNQKRIRKRESNRNKQARRASARANRNVDIRHSLMTKLELPSIGLTRGPSLRRLHSSMKKYEPLAFCSTSFTESSLLMRGR